MNRKQKENICFVLFFFLMEKRKPFFYNQKIKNKNKRLLYIDTFF